MAYNMKRPVATGGRSHARPDNAPTDTPTAPPKGSTSSAMRRRGRTEKVKKRRWKTKFWSKLLILDEDVREPSREGVS